MAPVDIVLFLAVVVDGGKVEAVDVGDVVGCAVGWQGAGGFLCQVAGLCSGSSSASRSSSDSRSCLGVVPNLSAALQPSGGSTVSSPSSLRTSSGSTLSLGLRVSSARPRSTSPSLSLWCCVGLSAVCGPESESSLVRKWSVAGGGEVQCGDDGFESDLRPFGGDRQERNGRG